MAPSTPRKDSQFAGAAALFRAKENEVKSPTTTGTPAGSKPSWTNSKFNNSAGNLRPSSGGGGGGGSSGGTNGFLSPTPSPTKAANLATNSKLAPPPFVSPGTKGRSTAPSWKKNLNNNAIGGNGTSTPTFGEKRTVSSSFAGLPFSPTTPKAVTTPNGSGKPKASWRDKQGGGISFQASSPGVYKKPAAAAGAASSSPLVPTTPTYYGGSYINKGSKPPSSPTKTSTTTSAPPTSGGIPEAEPDIQIKVNVDIQEKIKARRAHLSSMPGGGGSGGNNSVPEHVRRAREREERRLRAAEEKEYKSACLVQAAFLGWYARVQYPKLLEENAERLRLMKQREEETKRRMNAILTIQSTWRMYVPRKRYIFVRDCRRRREKNRKEMKRISKVIDKMPKDTKKDIKDLKKEYAEKKKDLKKQIKKQLKEEEKKAAEFRKQGQSMVDYMKSEQQKLLKEKESIKKDQQLLAAQTDLLKMKSDEIAKNFNSLQSWVRKKQAVIKQHEESDQRCRYKYLPKYREDMADRNKHCIAEYRVKEMYRKRLKKIVKEIESKSSDPRLVEEIQMYIKANKKQIKAIPKVPVPEGLADRL